MDYLVYQKFNLSLRGALELDLILINKSYVLSWDRNLYYRQSLDLDLCELV